MSHFTVLVIGDNHEEQLAPYHEFECTGYDDEYVQNIDKLAEAKEKFAEQTKTMYKDPQGGLHDAYNDEFYRDITPEEIEKIGPIGGTGCGNGMSWTSRDWGDGLGHRTKVHFMPDNYEEVQVQYEEVSTFAEWVRSWYGTEIIEGDAEPDLESEHTYGWVRVVNGEVVEVIDRTNPNAKWDWYQVGGRWSGMLKLKEKALYPAAVGEKGVMGAHYAEGDDRCDQCRIIDLDIEGMEFIAEKEANETFDKVAKIISTYGVPPRFEDLRKIYPDIDDARKMYGANPAVKAFRDKRLDPWTGDIVDRYFLETDNPRLQYVEKQKCAAFSTFAVVKDGEWYEKGEMGWWAAVHNEKLEYDWDAKFNELIHDLPEDTLISVIDCHI